MYATPSPASCDTPHVVCPGRPSDLHPWEIRVDRDPEGSRGRHDYEETNGRGQLNGWWVGPDAATFLRLLATLRQVADTIDELEESAEDAPDHLDLPVDFRIYSHGIAWAIELLLNSVDSALTFDPSDFANA